MSAVSAKVYDVIPQLPFEVYEDIPVIPGYEYTNIGMLPTTEFPTDDLDGKHQNTWQLVGDFLAERRERAKLAYTWNIGDWIMYGEHSYQNAYEAAMKATGYAYSTLKNIRWVAGQTPREMRLLPYVQQRHFIDALSIEDERKRKFFLTTVSINRMKGAPFYDALAHLTNGKARRTAATIVGELADKNADLAQAKFDLETQLESTKGEKAALERQVENLRSKLETSRYRTAFITVFDDIDRIMKRYDVEGGLASDLVTLKANFASLARDVLGEELESNTIDL